MTSDKHIARIIARVLVENGVKDVIASPGTRNAPIILAMTAVAPALKVRMVVDERSAAFIALGASVKSHRPVALVCTSGTACLNYLPAIAEAAVRQAPLIVITADRPKRLVDAGASQTLDHIEALKNFVTINSDIDYDADGQAKTLASLAVTFIKWKCQGPIHINIRLDEPLNGVIDDCDEAIVIKTKQRVTTPVFPRNLREIITKRRVLMLFTGCPWTDERYGYDIIIRKALDALCGLPDMVVASEITSPAKWPGMVHYVNETISVALKAPDLCDYMPEFVITVGSSELSPALDRLMRKCRATTAHIAIRGDKDVSPRWDIPYTSIQLTTDQFLEMIGQNMAVKKTEPGNFKRFWQNCSRFATTSLHQYLEQAPWSQWAAINKIAGRLGHNCNIHSSNGMTIRYLAACTAWRSMTSVCCNRGVSGIDGATSTAIGAAIMTEKPTVLLTGDMSFQYDLGALATNFIPENFKIIIFNNGGGGIFRAIANTRTLPISASHLTEITNLPTKQLADAWNFRYFKATDFETLDHAINSLKNSDKKAILEVYTDAETDAEIWRTFYKNLQPCPSPKETGPQLKSTKISSFNFTKE